MREFNAVVTIAFRDLTKLFRDKSRIAANFIFPIIFIGVLGSSLQANLKDVLTYNFLTFVFTGVLAQTVFQSTAAGMISLVEDRQNDFAQELFIAPISRYSIILGKILGETLVALIQVTGVVLFGFAIGVPLAFVSLVKLVPIVFVVAMFGGGFGLIVMANISEQRSINQLFPFLLFPQFFLAGVFNPIQDLPLPLLIASRLAPMTYAVDLVRSVYYSGQSVYEEVVVFDQVTNLAVIGVLSVLFLVVGTYMFVRNERNR